LLLEKPACLKPIGFAMFRTATFTLRNSFAMMLRCLIDGMVLLAISPIEAPSVPTSLNPTAPTTAHSKAMDKKPTSSLARIFIFPSRRTQVSPRAQAM
jgi:hypothetical protein